MDFTFIDLFAGIGGIRIPFTELGGECVFSSEWDKDAADAYEANYGHRPHGDITQINPQDIPDHDILVGGFPCFPAGAQILSKRGFLPIEEIVIGDEVLTHQNRWRRVLATMQKENAPTVVLKGQGHFGIETTAEHPFYALASRRDEIPVWKDAKDMVGQYWASPVNFPTLPIPELKIDVYEGRNLPTSIASVEFMRLVGLWVGDGWLRTGQRADRPEGQEHGNVLVCGNKRDEATIADWITETGLSATVSQERTTVRFTISSKPLTRWLETEFERGAANKKIPAWLFGQPDNLKNAFLEGLLFADGSIAKQPKGDRSYRRLTTVSKALAVGVRLLAASLGNSASMVFSIPKRTCVIEGRVVNERPFYTVSIFENSRKGFVRHDKFWGRVREVRPLGERKTVYNFEVEEDNSYVVDGFVVHNCQAFSIAGNQLGFNDTRGTLFYDVARILDAKKPRAFLLENVKNLRSHDGGRTFQVIVSTLESLGYHVHTEVLNALDFGLPQKRERTILVGFRDDLPFRMPVGSSKRADLADFLERDADQDPKLRASDYIIERRRAKIAEQGTIPFYPSIWHENKSKHVSVLPYSVALRANASHSYILVNGTRLPSPRELLNFQGFPPTFRIAVSAAATRKQAGNSVPVPMIRAVAQEMLRVMREA